MRQITEHTILAMPDAMKEIVERGRIIERQQAALSIAEIAMHRAICGGKISFRELDAVRAPLTEVYEVHGDGQ